MAFRENTIEKLGDVVHLGEAGTVGSVAAFFFSNLGGVTALMGIIISLFSIIIGLFINEKANEGRD